MDFGEFAVGAQGLWVNNGHTAILSRTAIWYRSATLSTTLAAAQDALDFGAVFQPPWSLAWPARASGLPGVWRTGAE